VEDGLPSLLEVFDGLEYKFAAETVDRGRLRLRRWPTCKPSTIRASTCQWRVVSTALRNLLKLMTVGNLYGIRFLQNIHLSLRNKQFESKLELGPV